MPAGLSIHVGLNSVDPKKYDGWDGRLVACENDARDMAELARGTGFDTTTVFTRDATAENVTAELRKAAKKLRGGDILLFTYSGHGGQVPDTEGAEIEPDGLDETLVLYDRQLLDDELHREFGRMEDGVRILALLDCCHSGTAIEAPGASGAQNGAASRFMPVVKQQQIYERDKEMFRELRRGLKAGGPGDAATPAALLISACQDNQEAADGAVNGAFTETLLRVWDKGAFRGGYRTFHRGIQRLMPATQSPNYHVTGTPTPEFLHQKPFTV
ncbi:caspase family protein [Streptomyces sp. NBC_01565]|uniref:caspase family protein n=1 Tax=unclassified Streptomyces TaxID=2593676 RepID=UPI0022567027|nr:caspase family protein [Streptomyces sp. NBC_01565]MCX4539560.1 caspase family protein [Streptomyces sp. NBC_01565]